MLIDFIDKTQYIFSITDSITTFVTGSDIEKLCNEIGDAYYEDALKYIRFAKTDQHPELHISQAAVAFRNSIKFQRPKGFWEGGLFYNGPTVEEKHFMSWIMAGMCHKVIKQNSACKDCVIQAHEVFLKLLEQKYASISSKYPHSYPNPSVSVPPEYFITREYVKSYVKSVSETSEYKAIKCLRKKANNLFYDLAKFTPKALSNEEKLYLLIPAAHSLGRGYSNEKRRKDLINSYIESVAHLF